MESRLEIEDMLSLLATFDAPTHAPEAAAKVHPTQRAIVEMAESTALKVVRELLKWRTEEDLEDALDILSRSDQVLALRDESFANMGRSAALGLPMEWRTEEDFAHALRQAFGGWRLRGLRAKVAALAATQLSGAQPMLEQAVANCEELPQQREILEMMLDWRTPKTIRDGYLAQLQCEAFWLAAYGLNFGGKRTPSEAWSRVLLERFIAIAPAQLRLLATARGEAIVLADGGRVEPATMDELGREVLLQAAEMVQLGGSPTPP
ncbi:MAG: hypothetical protein H6747_09000 [Deltaproteobacteria bacterium]|nr:hypothetical protein [Deltaproteobacteria bacterium]